MYVLLSCLLAVLANVISIVNSTCMNRDIINAIVAQKTLMNVVLIAAFYQLLYVIVNVVDTSVTMCFLNKQFVRISSELNKSVFYKAVSTKCSKLDDPAFYDNYSWTVKEYVNLSDSAVELLKKS